MTDIEKSAVTAHFDDYAAHWSERIRQHGYYSRYLVVKDMLGRLGRSAAVLDVGCGTGDYCTLFDPAVTKYVGIDISPAMVKRCRELYPGYDFRVGDGDHLDIPDTSVDLVLDVAVIEYYDDPLPHLRELARVTRPGGSIIVIGPNGNNRTRVLAVAIDRAVQRIKGHVKSPAEKRVRSHWRSLREISDLGAAAGLAMAEHRFASIYLVPELRPFVERLNVAVSRRISGKPFWHWLTSWSATNLVCRFVKP